MPGLFIVMGVAGVLGVTLTPLGRTIGNSMKNLLIADAMKNPRAAEAVYLTAIEETKKQYGQAADTYNQLSGMLIEANVGYTKVEEELAKTEEKCEKLARKNDLEGLQLLSAKRNSLLQRKDAYYKRMLELKPLVEEAKELHAIRQEEIIKLQEQKDLKVAELEITSHMNQMYAKLDKLRTTSATDKLLSHIDDNIQNQKRKAVGAKFVHENKLETKERKLEQRLTVADNDEYIKLLIDKYREG